MMSEHDDLLARLEYLAAKPKYMHTEADGAMTDAATAIRSLQAQLEAERKAREGAETQIKINYNWSKTFEKFFQSATERAEAAERRLAEVEQDARRYEILRKHTAPRELADHLCVSCTDIPRTQTILQKVDELVDAAIKESAAQEKGK